jgi:hypothetical protein
MAFLTDVIEAWNETEQRIQIRARPRRALEYSIVSTSPRVAAYAFNLLKGRQALTVGVPFWQYANRLTSAAGIGAASLLVSTQDVPWAAGDSILIWSDPWTAEVVVLSSAVSGQLNLTGVTTLAWPVGTWVMPIGDGRFAPEAQISLPSLETGQARFRFQLEPTAPVLTVASAAGGLTYGGFDVLDARELSRNAPIGEAFTRKIALLDSESGAIEAVALAAAPRSVKAMRWATSGRAEAQVLRAFIESRRGRAIPFWAPSAQSDLRLTVDLAATATIATVQWVGYTENIWPMGRAGRHIAFYTPGGVFEFKKIINATHTPGAATEALTLDSGVSQEYPAASTTIMLLRFCRLDADDVTIAWRGTKAEATIPLRELPFEEPL